MKLKTIHEVVGEIMALNKSMRSHKNRYKLYLRVCNILKKSLSPESVTRSQRKWWSEGLYRPSDYVEVSRKWSKKYKVFAR